MLRRLALLPLFALLALLGACQSNNVTQDFDASRDFAAYRSWSWQEPALQYRPDDEPSSNLRRKFKSAVLAI